MQTPDIDAQRRAAGLAPLPRSHQEPTPDKPELVTEDATIGNEERIRGIPAVGRVSGTIKGTRPGDPAQALELEHHGHTILRGFLHRTRRKDHP